MASLYVGRCAKSYLHTILDESNHLVWDIFGWAWRLSTFPERVRHPPLSLFTSTPAVTFF